MNGRTVAEGAGAPAGARSTPSPRLSRDLTSGISDKRVDVVAAVVDVQLIRPLVVQRVEGADVGQAEACGANIHVAGRQRRQAALAHLAQHGARAAVLGQQGGKGSARHVDVTTLRPKVKLVQTAITRTENGEEVADACVTHAVAQRLGQLRERAREQRGVRRSGQTQAGPTSGMTSTSGPTSGSATAPAVTPRPTRHPPAPTFLNSPPPNSWKGRVATYTSRPSPSSAQHSTGVEAHLRRPPLIRGALAAGAASGSGRSRPVPLVDASVPLRCSAIVVSMVAATAVSIALRRLPHTKRPPQV